MKKYFIITLLLISSIFCQINDPSSENYKSALRMKLRMEANPRLYMDEPRSALLNNVFDNCNKYILLDDCLLYTSPSPRDRQKSRMPSSA